jgi:gamma-glutamyltranspeptidase/glutathione hydrolase
VPTPDLAAGIASANDRFRAAVTGTGQEGAAEAASDAMEDVLHNQNTNVPDPGRANVISCPGYVPGGEATCLASADPRLYGFAVGGR